MNVIKRKVFLLSLVTALTIGLLSTYASTQVKKIGSLSSDTTLFVTPSTVMATVNQVFEVSITVSNVTDLFGWEFKLSYNTSALQIVNVVEGSFLNSSRDTYFVPKVMSTDGYVLAGCTVLRNVAGVNGNGTLATIEFLAKEEGTSIVNLYDTKLVNSLKQLTPHNTINGTVTVHAPDINVTSVTTSKNAIQYGQSMLVSATVWNQGNLIESINATLYIGSTPVDTKNILIAGGETAIINFTWDTTGWGQGLHKLSAHVSPVPNETNTTDNIRFYNSPVLVVFPAYFHNMWRPIIMI